MCDSPAADDPGHSSQADHPMPGVLGAAELAARYGVSQQWARALLAAWWQATPSADQAPPRVYRVSERRVVRNDDLLRWEKDQRTAGRYLPGERRRGPVPERPART